ncbi:MAG: ABC transporter permease [Caldilineaceae bacterium]|nr:ABC transporter permease [Caldilineaceae bacterium]
MTAAGRVVPSAARQPMGENKWLAPLIVFVAVMALWEAAVRLLQVPVFLLPPPSAILTTFVSNAGTLLLYGFNTFRQAFFGFAIGCGLGILVAMVTARSQTISDVLIPLAVASNSVPIVAMAPLAIVWFGIGEGSKIAIVAIMCFFPTLVSTVRGLMAVSPAEVELMRSYAATEWETFRKLRVPAALPYLFNAFRICTTLSMIGAIVAEFFGGSVKYLGVYIKTEANILHTTNAWAAIVVACLIGLIFYLAVVGVEWVLMPWQSSRRVEER